MSDIFVSYRREDSPTVVGRLVDRLETQFGKEHIFRDIESIEYGAPFDEAIIETLTVCKVVLVIIGRKWLDIRDNEGVRRLDKQDDWVRAEVAKSLEQKIYVIPVLVDGAVMPSADELPEDLKPLASRNAAQVRNDPDFNNDVERLFSTIISKKLFTPQKHHKSIKKPVVIGVLLAVLFIAMLIGVFQQEIKSILNSPTNNISKAIPDIPTEGAFKCPSAALNKNTLSSSYQYAEKGIDQILVSVETDETLGDQVSIQLHTSLWFKSIKLYKNNKLIKELKIEGKKVNGVMTENSSEELTFDVKKNCNYSIEFSKAKFLGQFKSIETHSIDLYAFRGSKIDFKWIAD